MVGPCSAWDIQVLRLLIEHAHAGNWHGDKHEVEGEPGQVSLGVDQEILDGLGHVRLLGLATADTLSELVVDDVDDS